MSDVKAILKIPLTDIVDIFSIEDYNESQLKVDVNVLIHKNEEEVKYIIGNEAKNVYIRTSVILLKKDFYELIRKEFNKKEKDIKLSPYKK